MTPEPRSNPRSSKPSPDGQPGFEDMVEQLEQIIERIEGGEVGLEQSIAEYEKGMALIKRCREILEKAEQKVEELGKGSGRAGGDADDK